MDLPPNFARIFDPFPNFIVCYWSLCVQPCWRVRPGCGPGLCPSDRPVSAAVQGTPRPRNRPWWGSRRPPAGRPAPEWAPCRTGCAPGTSQVCKPDWRWPPHSWPKEVFTEFLYYNWKNLLGASFSLSTDFMSSLNMVKLNYWMIPIQA